MDPREIQCDCIMPRYLEGYNVYTGKGDVIRLCCLAREVERLTGKQFVFEFDLPESEIQDWDANQETQRVRRETEIAEYNQALAAGRKEAMERPRPITYITKRPPAWVAAGIQRQKRR